MSLEKSRVMESSIIRLTYPNGKVYRGEFMNDKPNGKGTLTHSDGLIVTGIWKNGHMDGSDPVE